MIFQIDLLNLMDQSVNFIKTSETETKGITL